MLSCHITRKNEVKLGVILPLTGELAPFGQKLKKGILLAIKDFNNKNNNLTISLIIEDDKGENNNTINAFNKITQINNAEIVIGTLTSGGTLAIAPVAQKNKILLISPTASSPKLSKIGKYFYRVWASDNLDGVISAQYCFNSLKLKKIAVCYQNNDYCIGLKNIFETKFKSLGGLIVNTAGYDEGHYDFRTFIAKLKGSHCDGIYLPGHPIGISTFLKQAKQIDLSAKFISNVAVEDKDFITLAGSTSDSLIFTSPAFDITSQTAAVIAFEKSYRAAYNEEPDIFGVKGYEAADVILRAVYNKKVSPKDIADYIHSTRIFKMIEGDLVFDINGDVTTAVSVKQYINNKPSIIETIKPL